MASSVVNAVFGFIFWTAAARLYHPEEVGLAAAAISMGSLLAMVSTAGLDQAMVRFLPRASDARAVINSALTIGSIFALGLSIAFLAGLPLWSPVLLPLQRAPLFVVGLTVATVFTTLTSVIAGVFLARKQAVFVLIQSTLFSIIKVFFAVILPVVQVVGLVSAWALGLVTAVTCAVAFFLPRIEAEEYRFRMMVERTALNGMAHFAFANYVSGALWSASTFLLPILIVNIAGPEANAYFYVATSVGGFLAIIPAAISQSLFAHGSQDDSKLARHTIEGTRLTLLLLIPAIVGMCLFGGKVLLLFGRSYSAYGTGLLSLFAAGTLPLSVNLLFFGVRKAQQRMGVVIVATSWILTVTLGLSTFLLPRIGLIGAGVAWITAQSSVAVPVIFICLMRTRISKSFAVSAT